jgi:predicted nucleotidyltransferase
MNSDDLAEALRDIARRLTDLGVSFYLTGGIVSTFYGEPRFTQDIDLVVQIPASVSIDALLEAVSPDYFSDRDQLERAVREGGMAQLLHETRFVRIDLHLGERVPGAAARKQTMEVFPGVRVPIASKEDAILSKLHWIRLGSEKSRRDVTMMLRRDTPVDWDYLRTQADSLGLSDLLKEFEG